MSDELKRLVLRMTHSDIIMTMNFFWVNLEEQRNRFGSLMND